MTGDGAGKPVERARELALSYLDRRMRSRIELARYLRRRGFPGEVIDRVLDEIAASGHLDDRAFARAFARDRVRLAPRGYRLIAREIEDRGVARDLVDRALAEVEAEFPEVDVARALLRGRRRRLAGRAMPQQRRTIEGWLVRRGFRRETIRRVLEEGVEE